VINRKGGTVRIIRWGQAATALWAMSAVLSGVAAQPAPTVAKGTGSAQKALSKQPVSKAPAAKAPAAKASAAADPAPRPETIVAAPVPQADEKAFMQRVDVLIAPVLNAMPSDEDAARIREAVRKGGLPDAAAARAEREKIADPAGRRLAEWVALKAQNADPAEFSAFLERNPDWPERALLTRRGEERLFTSGGNARAIKAFFKGAEPQTAAGFGALASAYLAEKDEKTARDLARRAWTDYDLAASLEAGFLERFGSLLSEKDHKRRLDRALVDDARFAAERNERAAIAKRVVARLSDSERKKAEARIAIYLRAGAAATLYAALPAEPQGATDWGLAYQRVQHLRRGNHHEEAWKILKAAPTDAEVIVSPDNWWSERRAAAFDALKAGKAQVAYDLVRDAGPLTVNPLKEQTFMAGWIAFRLLKKPADALRHFEASRAAADGPLSKARADYWAGRALDVLKRGPEAQARYKAASTEPDTFHGQLSLHRMAGRTAPKWRPTLPAMPTEADVKRFGESHAVRAAVIASRLSLDRNYQRAIFGHLRNTMKTEGEVVLVAHLAAALGDPQASVRIGKTAIGRGMNLIVYAYPVTAFTSFTALRAPPEMAFLLGIARQETEFNNSIVSTAGARGLLQVMPVTAQHVCRDYKLKCDIPRLLTDNRYNATIASAYIADRMGEFSGSYVLGLAGYNAGPGRARQWIRQFGDPRQPGVDPIDWIENIPIEETREYVKKVLSNIQVYRARLGEATPVRLEQDLRRGVVGAREATE
jgi:soluble lytic murein transglycosylase